MVINKEPINKTDEKEPTQEDIERLMQKVVFDSVIECFFCGYNPLEPDYRSCPECHRKNPLMVRGLI